MIYMFLERFSLTILMLTILMVSSEKRSWKLCFIYLLGFIHHQIIFVVEFILESCCKWADWMNLVTAIDLVMKNVPIGVWQKDGQL